MSDLCITIGDTDTFTCTVTTAGKPTDLTGILGLTFILQRTVGAVGQEVARWGLGAVVAIQSPPTAGIAVLTVTPAMINWVRPPTSWALEPQWAADTKLQYTWSLTDALGNVTGRLEQGTFTLEAAP